MKTYKILLMRTYLVSIKARDLREAEFFSEFYIGDCRDLSGKEDHLEKKFTIKDIEMVWNEAYKFIE